MPNRDPIIAAAFSARFAGGVRRSTRAPIVACSVGGTLTSAILELAAVCTTFADDHLSFGELAHDFLDIERVSGRVFDDVCLELVD